MAGSEQRRAAGNVELDSRPILTAPDGNQNITEVDALDIRQSLDPAVQYKMNHQRRGVALIFNHEHFNWRLKLGFRRGTAADRDNLSRTLTGLGFEVRVFEDLPAEEVLQTIHEASKDDHSDADCFICVFLSHGEDDHIYAFDGQIKIETITDMFRGDKCQSLVGKPKIFIIQACRGDKHDDPVIAQDSTDTSDGSIVNETEVDAAAVYTLPAGADFIMCYSVAQGEKQAVVKGDQEQLAWRGFGSVTSYTSLKQIIARFQLHLQLLDLSRQLCALVWVQHIRPSYFRPWCWISLFLNSGGQWRTQAEKSALIHFPGDKRIGLLALLWLSLSMYYVVNHRC
ncbi:PREDICTED: caspase-6 isoform X1 [Calidris pugnax]|uniref:caspase-6 isoform X1 n=1 Tax=Calidris pugnax TaxID=198806 RepID=UPI00071C9FB3|nr:PREDICTED: caspase-6 isoform X1 [Calidris pugnax]